MDNLENFIHDHDDRVSSAAELLFAAQQGYEAGEITKEQLDELAEDVLQIGEMQEFADDLERKIHIQKAFGVIKHIIKSLT